jgi:curved DNA-binding protein CbpA
MMEVLGIEAGFTGRELKRRFQVLVKRYHPDLHGGDTSFEDKLRAVIEAYRFLRPHAADAAA